MSSAVEGSVPVSRRSTDARRTHRIRKWLAVPKNLLHVGVLTAYIAVVITVMCFHEPWFDEAQSWLMARDCSWHDLLLVRPHYEGHPPFWWLLLAIPARLGVPYEWGIKSIQLMTAVFFVWLLIFRSGLPKVLRIILPFTYFVCFQDGVTSRPYALMHAAMLLAGLSWRERDDHPWRLIGSLVLLCLCSSYGVVLAGSITMVWVWRVWRQHGIRGVLMGSKPRLAGWLVLLAVGLGITALVWPRPNTYDSGLDLLVDSPLPSTWQMVLRFWLCLPSEMMFTSVFSDVMMCFASISAWEWAMMAVFSCLVWAVFFHLAYRRGELGLLIIPYAMMSVLGVRYFAAHHEGIILGFFIMVLCVLCRDCPLNMNDVPAWMKTLGVRASAHMSNRDRTLCINLGKFVGVLLLSISVYWNVYACVADVLYPYSQARALASLIERGNLQNERMMSGWSRLPATKEQQQEWQGAYCGGGDNCIDFTTWYPADLIVANPYFNKNLISNSPDDSSYLLWYQPAGQAKKDLETWKNEGEPALYFTSFQPFFFNELGYKRADYIEVQYVNLVRPWKDQYKATTCSVYMRRDVYRKVFHKEAPNALTVDVDIS
ncbi:ABC superfamily ATP binding cassette transporter permease protein [Bifidobacterium thermophilum]|uniref:hypothetical protein n=1 Tax=Bifidobacterium thermophilum TaxID=33905 RepID=UPI000CC62A7C|nr:hypothetical protein [Bifidobacterium thermophilum]PKU90397.1 ABC superfamily ATP binding cassette transporter permease protein [Bifidobacterium thermophilum]